MDWKLWLKGLGAAIVNGAAGSVAGVIADPATFNPMQGGIKNLAILAGISALLGAANYLKQSPLPK